MSTNKLKKIVPSEWISPAEAARRRGVTRQAIRKLIQTGRLSVMEIGGRYLVKLTDVLEFKPLKPGRPKGDKNAS